MIPTLLNAIPIPVLWLEEIDRVLFANGSAEALFGPGLDGRLVTDVLRHPEFHAALETSINDDRAARLRLSLMTRLGQRLYDIQISPTGRDEGAVISFEDQTAVDRATLMRRDFVANVSHELRTPLTALVGFIETLRGAARDDAAARERFLEIMEREAGRMIRLVNDLLSLSRVEAEEHRRPSERVELAALIRSVAVTHRDAAASAGIEIAIDGAEAPYEVTGDADQLAQVFHNLTENGIKYGGGGGKLDITLARIAREPKLQGPAIAVTVSDHGEGIDPIHLPRLTERFYRVDSHRSREKGGTGLGLAIVKHIVNRHRGRLKIESEPGKGSKFTIILPAA